MAAIPRWPSAAILDIIEPEIAPFDPPTPKTIVVINVYKRFFLFFYKKNAFLTFFIFPTFFIFKKR